MYRKVLAETLAALGVIASLIFVGLEIRQNRLVAQSQAIQSLTQMSIQLRESIYADPEFRREYYEWVYSTPKSAPSRNERTESGVYVFIGAMLRLHESTFMQVSRGILDEQDISLYGFRNQPTYQAAAFPFYWPIIRNQYHPDFVDAMEAEYALDP